MRGLGGFGEEFVGHFIGVMLAADSDAMTDPFADRELGEGHGPFFFAGTSQGLPQSGPRLYLGTFDIGNHHSVQIAARLNRNNASLTFWGHSESFCQEVHELWNNGHHAPLVTWMVLGFRAADIEPPVLPVHIGPRKQMGFAGSSQAGVARQGENHGESWIGTGSDDGVGFVRRDVTVVSGSGRAAGQVLEGTLADEAAAACFVENAFGIADVMLHAGFGNLTAAILVAGKEPLPPFRRIVGRNKSQGCFCVEELEQLCTRPFQIGNRAGFEVIAAGVQIIVEEKPQHCRFARTNQSRTGQPFVEAVVAFVHPFRGFGIMLAERKVLHAQLDLLRLLHRGNAEPDFLPLPIAIGELDALPAAGI